MAINIKALSDAEVVRLMSDLTPLARARLEFSSAMARIEQAEAQRKKPTIIELRRMEFEAAQAIAQAAGIEL